MEYNQIITEVYNSKEVNNLINGYRPIELQQDLKQQSFLRLLEQEHSKILSLHENNKLINYTLIIISNTAKSKKYTLGIDERIIPTTNLDLEIECEKYQEININFDELYWYDAEILKLYFQHGSIRKVSALTTIPSSSIFYTIKNAKLKIKSNGEKYTIKKTV